MATTPGTTPTDLEFIGHIINDKLNEQPKGRTVANTISAVVGAIVSIAAVALSMPIDLPDWAYLIIVAVTTLGTALGVKQTHNGFSESQRRKLQEWQAEYIDARHTHDDTVDEQPDPEPEYVGQHRLRDTVNDAARDLTDWVDRFNADRRSR
ncbi:MAG: hypothetical protein ACI38U_03090 [Corynebacterium sp.]|uniref:hypothetical protein n=1 Tax=Corynebacterium sp. TaxID=1720 RepID=UPI003F0D8F3B